MTSILHIDASPRATRSRSRAVADRFMAALPDAARVERLDLWQASLPALGGDMIEGRYDLLFGQPVAPEIAEAWDEIRRMADQFLAHDAYVISTPMWNFGVPYALKHYVDVVTQPGMTFRNDALGNVEGLAASKRAVILAASAMPFGSDTAIDPLDHQVPYLMNWLGFIGIERIDTIRAGPTFGPEDAVAEVMERACRQAEDVACSFA